VDTYLKQFVIFSLEGNEYGIDISLVTTIEKSISMARVPRTPAYIMGVINLRGEIIPVVDMRTMFDYPQKADTEDTRIIVLTINETVVGIRVDAVAEVAALTQDSIENTVNVNNDEINNYIMGVGKINNRIITLLNMEKFLDSVSGQTRLQ